LSKQIWLAPILSNNRERLLERASDVLASGPAEGLLYLAASRPLLELAADRLLDGVRNRGVWGSLPVHLFRGLARFVLATATEDETGLPLAPRIAIDQEELPLRRSLISQIIKRLARDGKLKAIAPLANREGCINTIATLIGEIQRAARTPAEFNAIIDARARDLYAADRQDSDSSAATEQPVPLQIDFDREIGSIYLAYAAALVLFGLTEDDADQLRALDVLRGDVGGKEVSVPWLPSVRLLVVDGFFDFTPVQGEMLRLLIPQIPSVIVNLNRDTRNAEIFHPFERAIDQLKSIAEFEIHESAEAQPVAAGLSRLRERLFNPIDLGAQALGAQALGAQALGAQAPLPAASGGEPASSVEALASSSKTPGRQGCLRSQGLRSQGLRSQESIRVLDCGNRQTELRAIAKEIKRLVLLEGYRPGEVAVVVRQRASYEDAITRIFEEEQIHCTLSRRISLTEVPAVRAAVKLFELLIELARQDGALKVSNVADLVKSGYFGLAEGELVTLRERFEREDQRLLEVSGYRRGPDELKVGNWDADELENAIAYVGGELRVQTWIRRAHKLTARPPEPPEEKLSDAELDGESDSDDEAPPAPDETFAVRKVRAGRVFEPVDIPLPGSERRAKPAREVHPALIAWSALIVDRFARLLTDTPREAGPREMRDAVMRLLDQLQFAREVRGAPHANVTDAELPALTLDLRGLEGLRRALAAATRSIEISERAAPEGEPRPTIKLATLLEETMRCVKAQSLMLGGGDPDGLKVLEATDIRGLRFRAVFIAGLIEGGFPLRASRDWIYPHEERERLKQYGLTLEDISPDTLLKEEHYFYQAACRATERLYLTRPLVMEDGSETVASYYIEELARAVAPAKINKETLRNDFDGRTLFDASRTSELAMLLVRQDERRRHRAQRDGNFPNDVIGRLVPAACELGYLSESARRRIAVERERGGGGFGKFDGVIGSATLIERLREQYGVEHDFSASELSLYGKCPFKFFAEKVLRLEPRGEAALDLTALDAGSLLHEALRRFFEAHRGERLTELDRSALRRELGKAADAVFDEHERTVPPLNPQVWRIDREIRKLLLEQILDYELTVEEQTRSKDVRPAYFELAFGMQNDAIDPNSTDQRLELQRASGDQTESVRLRGQIDRVDRARDGTVIAYDYKLSKGAGLDDMTEGRALQLHVYIAALEQVLLPGSEIAGGGYYTIKGLGARRNQGLYRVTMKDYTGVGGGTSSSLSDTDWKRIRGEMQARIWEFVDGMRGGRFAVAPSAPEDTCPHCDFSAVCRYEKFRIRRKQGGGPG
jgi:ATP-dependent helicase/DNAse subunit B